MTSARVDPALVFAWQEAHSVARGAPPPVHDHGGFRVDTRSENERMRWVFPQPCGGLHAVACSVTEPGCYLKLCGDEDALQGALPPGWEIQPAAYLMTATDIVFDPKPLADGYRLELQQSGPVTQVRILARDGELAASGQAAETAAAFVYDRIETALEHRRKGLGAVVMAALGSTRTSPAATPLLVATEEGRSLYARLGWTVLSPLATATIPAALASSHFANRRS
ncbi:GNAT family N-acetyltransferase [Caulobacter sp. LARHSG274]